MNYSIKVMKNDSFYCLLISIIEFILFPSGGIAL
jgi:hypothetical protein